MPRLDPKKVVGVLVTLSVIDALVVGYVRSCDRLQWAAVSDQNVLRLSVVDRLVERAFRPRDGNLDVANDALSRERKVHLLSPGYEQSIARSGGSDTPRGDFKNVVLITLESLSTHYANDATTMPFWSQFSNQWC